MFFSYLVALILLSITTIVCLYKVSFNYWSKRRVYTWKPSIPFGNAKNVILQRIPFGFDVLELYKDIKSKSLRYGGYYMCYTPVFVPVDLNLIKKITINDFDYFSDRVAHVDQKNDPISANLLHLRRERWEIIRSKIRPFISSKKIKKAFPLLRQCADTLASLVDKTIKKEGCVDIKDVLDRFNIDLVGAFFLKVNCDTMMNKDQTIKNKITNFFNTSVKDTVIRLFISLPAVIKFCKIRTYNTEVTQFFTQFVEDVLESRRKEDKIDEDVLNALVSKDVPLTKSEIVANTALLFLAGYDTNSNSTSFCLYELSISKELQDTARREINEVLQKHDGKYSYSVLAELIFLEKCIKETLRKYPMGHIISRLCIKSYSVPDSDLVLTKGTNVYLPTRAIHWDPDYYPNPEVFDPERFADDNNVNRHPCIWMPFGVGPRHCIGYKLAYASLKMSLAVLLQKYEFSLHSSSDGPMQYDAKAYLLQSKEPIRLIAKKIQN